MILCDIHIIIKYILVFCRTESLILLKFCDMMLEIGGIYEYKREKERTVRREVRSQHF